MPRRALPWLFGGFVLLLCGLGANLHFQAKVAAEGAAWEALHSTSRLTAHGLNLWLAERHADAEAFSLAIPLYEAAPRPSERAPGQLGRNPLVQEHIERFRALYGYRAVAVVDAATGTALFSAGRVLSRDQTQYVARAAASALQQAQWLELPAPKTESLIVGIGRGIAPTGGKARFALYLELEPAVLVATLKEAQPLSWKGETVLVRRDPDGLRYLAAAGGTELKPLTETSVKRGGQAQPVAEALLMQGSAKQVQAPNRDGVPVMAMRETVNLPGWILVSQLDEHAVYAPLYRRTTMLMANLAALLALATLAFIAWRRSEAARYALRDANMRRYYEEILRNADDLFVLADADGRILDANESALRALGYTREQMLRLTLQKLAPPSEPHGAIHLVQGMRPGDTRPVQMERQRADGSVFTFAGSVGLVEVDGQRFYHSIGRDVTQLRKVETQLRVAASFFERSAAAVVISDAERRILSVNSAFTRVTGYVPEEVIGQLATMLNADLESDATQQARTGLRDHDHWEGEMLGRRKGGEVVPVRVLMTAYRNAKGHVDQYVDIVTDLSRLKRAENQAEYLAHNDSLTGLPNRAQLERQLPALLAQAGMPGSRPTSVGVALLNVDRFQAINESLGHAQGDALLVAVAQRLRPLFPNTQYLYRYGGDEFILVMLGNSVTQALQIGMVRSAIAPPLLLGEHSVSPTASIGVASFPEHADNADALLRNAEAAMRMAKAHGRNTWRLYQPEMNATAYDDMLLAVDLRQAIDRTELHLNLQPQFRLEDDALVGMEALLRWKHPTRGMVSPARFIPIAESSGLIVELSNWVLREACRLWADWKHRGLNPPPVAVNISALHFQHQDFLQEVADAMSAHGLPMLALQMEITESLIMAGTEAAIGTMHRLVEMGIELAIDDFGTGYSSLSYLQRFPVKKLKIDRSFVLDLGKGINKQGAAIASAVIAMAKSLNLKVIAEGVETLEQKDFLHAHGCDEVQGYLYGRPMPSDDMARLLGERLPIGPASEVTDSIP